VKRRGAALLIIGSENALVGLDAGWDVLSSGGSALDAVERAIRIVEDNLQEHSVGTGGLPNVLGEVELDASIMDGSSRRAGAVGALKGFPNPISVARAVMGRLPHVLLVGEGAARFAEECGFEPAELLTEAASDGWKERLRPFLGEDVRPPEHVLELTARLLEPLRAAGTVDVIAIDAAGHIASGVSTSGWPLKYPGRVGDSPVIGAGNYADDRFGAAACTGFGELAMRATTARDIVAALEAGRPVGEACAKALRALESLDDVPRQSLVMSVVAVGRDGTHAAASFNPTSRYAYREAHMEGAELRERTIVMPTGA
jgi:L-asparaginase / beta-aspartyl-peptidase